MNLLFAIAVSYLAWQIVRLVAWIEGRSKAKAPEQPASKPNPVVFDLRPGGITVYKAGNYQVYTAPNGRVSWIKS